MATYKFRGKFAYAYAFFYDGDGSCSVYDWIDYNEYTDVSISMYDYMERSKDGTGKPDVTQTNGISIYVSQYNYCNDKYWFGYADAMFGGFGANFLKNGASVKVNTVLCNEVCGCNDIECSCYTDKNDCKRVVLEGNITPSNTWSQGYNYKYSDSLGYRYKSTSSGKFAEAKFEIKKLVIDKEINPLDAAYTYGFLGDSKDSYSYTYITYK